MPNPTAGDVHVNRPLTNISIAYMQDPAGFVADKVFPSISVQKQSDRYFAYDRSDFMRHVMQKRAPGTESAGGGWKVDNTPSYFADVWALHKDIEDQIRSNADDPLNMDRDATIYLSQQALLNREIQFATNWFASGKWTTDVTGVSASPGINNVLQWNDANSNPISDIKQYANTIHQNTAYRPNKLVMGRQVWTQLSEHPDIVARIQYSSSNNNPAIVTKAATAALFELDEILVMDAIQVTSAENPTFETSMTRAFVGGKSALLVYSNPTPSILQPSGGYTFSWTGFVGAGNMGQRIKRFRMEHLESDRVESQMAYAQKQIGADLGVFFATVVA